MPFSVNFVVDTKGMERLIDALETIPEVTETYGNLIAEKAADNAPVDTGALRDSIKSEMINDTTAWIHDGVEYGIFQELGTSRMAAQPFFIPAIESYIESFISSIKALFR